MYGSFLSLEFFKVFISFDEKSLKEFFIYFFVFVVQLFFFNVFVNGDMKEV